MWISKLKDIEASGEFRKSQPIGHILLTKWFDPSRKLFTEITYSTHLTPLKTFLNIIQQLLSKFDAKRYGTSSKIKSFLTDFIRYAPRHFENYKKKMNEEEGDEE